MLTLAGGLLRCMQQELSEEGGLGGGLKSLELALKVVGAREVAGESSHFRKTYHGVDAGLQEVVMGSQSEISSV